jgi:hypothetical protein
MDGERGGTEAGYRVFMLRMWTEPGSTVRARRYDLEDPRTRQRRGFCDSDALVAYLEGLPAAREPERGSIRQEDKGARAERRCAEGRGIVSGLKISEMKPVR